MRSPPPWGGRPVSARRLERLPGSSPFRMALYLRDLSGATVEPHPFPRRPISQTRAKLLQESALLAALRACRGSERGHFARRTPCRLLRALTRRTPASLPPRAHSSTSSDQPATSWLACSRRPQIDIAIHRNWIGREERIIAAETSVVAELPFGEQTRDYSELRLRESRADSRLTFCCRITCAHSFATRPLLPSEFARSLVSSSPGCSLWPHGC